MHPKTLKVKNFTSYKEETFDYDGIQDIVAIIGTNGGGKSSFFVDAVTTVLFNRARGTTSIGTGLENLIHNGEEELEVDFTFMNGESEIRVIRKRFRKGGQELQLFIDKIDHTDKIKETQAKLESIIKLDYETFLDTVCIGQGESGRFMKKAPNERKGVITNVLNLDNYDVLQEFTKEIKKETKQNINSLANKLEDLGNLVSDEDDYREKISENESLIPQIEISISSKEIELEDELKRKAQYEEAVKNRNEILNKQKNIQNKVDSTKESINKGTMVKQNLEATISLKEDIFQDLENSEIIFEKLQNQFSDLRSNKSSLEATNSMLESQAKELKAKFTKLKEHNEAECGFCGQEITEDHKQKHLNDMMNEGKKYLSQINANKEEINKIDLDLNSINVELSATKNKISNLRTKKSEIEQSETKLSSVITRLEDLTNDLVYYEKELEEAMSIKVEEIENVVVNDVMIKGQLNVLRNQLSNKNSEIAVWKNELKKIEQNKDKVTRLESEIKVLQEELMLLDEIAVAWGKEGIQAVIIDNALPEIEDEINSFLGSLTDDRVSIEFITQKDKGKGKKISSIETLDIMIHDEMGYRTYETYSGGEKFRVDFSCHVGLSKFLAKRAGANINFFIVDEGIGSQDANAKELFVNAVQKLSTVFDKVIIITHIDDIIESFPNRVEIYKDPLEGSKIRIN